MKYSMKRLINLGKYGPSFQYENIEICVEDCESWEQAESEIKKEMLKINEAYTNL